MENKNKCKDCGREFWNDHHCNPDRISFYQQQRLRVHSMSIIKELYFDIETRNDIDNITTITDNKYYLQVATLLSFVNHETKQSYLGLDCIDRFLQFLLQETPEHTFYNIFAHNGSKFDFFFIIEAIMKDPLYNTHYNAKQSIFKGSRIITFWFRGHKFIDTMNFVAGSLEKLCDDFKVKNKKIKEFTIGDKLMTSMDICLYEGKNLNPTQYLEYLQTNDEMRYAYIEYCEYDCISLQELHQNFCGEMTNVVNTIYQEKGYAPNIKNDIKSASTLPGFIFKIWKDVEKNDYVPEGKEREDLGNSIIGGISDVNKKGKFDFPDENNRGCVIDVVSLYVSQMIQQQYPKGKPIVCDGYVRDKLGVYRVENIIFPPDSREQIKDIPRKTKTGLDWHTDYIDECWLTSVDLERMKKNRVRFTVREGYYWEETYNPFSLLTTITNVKMQQDVLKSQKLPFNDALRNCCKLSGNSLYGKMMERSKNYEFKNFDSLNDIEDDLFNSSTNICYTNGQFITKIESDVSKSPLQFGTFILAYARECIMTYADMVGRENIYTMETDSIMCSIKDITLVEHGYGTYKIGKELGNMEIELDTITQGIFCAKKCYALQYISKGNNKDDPKEKAGDVVFKMRFKGVPKKLLKYGVYKELFEKGTYSFNDIAVWKRQLFASEKTGILIGSQTKTIKI